MKTKLLPDECEFCGEKVIKEESISGTFYRCLRCGMVHGELHIKIMNIDKLGINFKAGDKYWESLELKKNFTKVQK